MALLTITKLYDENFFSQLGSEYICTGFMYNAAQSVPKSMASQLSSWDFSGVIEGDLEQINVHEGANTFHIYPAVGPKKITCRFPNKLYEDAVAAVGKRVEVYGILRFRPGASYPHQIALTDIEIFPPESELPAWDDLRGRAPNATGGLSSEAFVRELRDGWR